VVLPFRARSGNRKTHNNEMTNDLQIIITNDDNNDVDDTVYGTPAVD
jgi:hypothetical protein